MKSDSLAGGAEKIKDFPLEKEWTLCAFLLSTGTRSRRTNRTVGQILPLYLRPGLQSADIGVRVLHGHLLEIHIPHLVVAALVGGDCETETGFGERPERLVKNRYPMRRSRKKSQLGHDVIRALVLLLLEEADIRLQAAAGDVALRAASTPSTRSTSTAPAASTASTCTP